MLESVQRKPKEEKTRRKIIEVMLDSQITLLVIDLYVKDYLEIYPKNFHSYHTSAARSIS